MTQEKSPLWTRRALLRAGAAVGIAVPVAAAGVAAIRLRDDVPQQGTAAQPSSTSTQKAASTNTPATQAPTASPTPTATPSPTPPPATSFEFRPNAVGNGEATLLMVRATERAGTVRFIGRTIPLRQQGEFLWAILGVPVDAVLGPRVAQVTLVDAQGKTRQIDATTEIVHVQRPVDYLIVTEEIGAVLTPEAGIREDQLRAKEFATFDPDVRWSRPFVKPAAGDVTTQFGSGRSINGGPIGGFHTGADIANDHGTLIVAAGPGRVAYVEQHPIRGLSVILDHGSGVLSGYHHLNSSIVTPGVLVEAGTPIARMGSTGFSTGPHLHWEVTVYGVNVDPFTWTQQSFRP